MARNVKEEMHLKMWYGMTLSVLSCLSLPLFARLEARKSVQSPATENIADFPVLLQPGGEVGLLQRNAFLLRLD